MRSALLDRPDQGVRRAEVRELLVLWQHPETREIIPIGRFCHLDGQYAFTYTRAATDIEGFRPLLGLGDLHRRYRGQRIPAIFDQRVMSPERPDYDDYLGTLGLSAEQATPWEQIVESGGSRAGDTLQFMQVPTVTDGRARARFLINGIRHIPDAPRRLPDRVSTVTREDQEVALSGLAVGDPVSLEPELDNPQDRSAVLLTVRGTPVGWVPRAISASVRELMVTGATVATVHRIGEPGTPAHLRLVVDLDVPAPEGFTFDREGRWAPIGAGSDESGLSKEAQ